MAIGERISHVMTVVLHLALAAVFLGIAGFGMWLLWDGKWEACLMIAVGLLMAWRVGVYELGKYLKRCPLKPIVPIEEIMQGQEKACGERGDDD